jgi:Asp-tRNA(Asn)/Glu-tRNA(Gln) amidotransferase A subunit family amidase
MYLERLKKYGPRLLCVVNLTEQLALKQAARADEEIAAGKYRGPLHGVPYGAKDLLATKGVPTTYGVSVYKDQVFDFDATVIAKLEEVGAVLVAKLSLGELAMGDVWYGGKTRTPWDAKEGSSGSSAGPAAATTAGLVGFSIGSETLGSIVSPCVQNGIVGLRPTWGRVSRYGALPLTWTLDKLGPICRGVEDCALVLYALHGADPKDPTAADVPFVWDPQLDLKSLRIGYDARAFDFDNKEVWKDESLVPIYRDAFEKVKSIVGSDLKPITLPPARDYSGLVGTIIAVESSSAFGDLLTSGRINDLVQQEKGSWPNTFRVGATVPAADYLRAQRLRTMLMREMHEALKDVDCFVTVPYSGPTLAFTNLCGQPSLVTRCGTKDGRPKMIEFVGNLYREDAILRLGFAYEQATTWRDAHPDVEKLPETPP